MRPLVNGEALTGRPRKATSPDDPASSTTPLARSRPNLQATYFLADEKTLEAAEEEGGQQFPRQDKEPIQDSSYGVHSLDDHLADGSLGLFRNTLKGVEELDSLGSGGDSSFEHPAHEPETSSDTEAQWSDPEEPSPQGKHLDVQTNSETLLQPSESSLSGTGTPQCLTGSVGGSSIPSSPKSLSSKSFHPSDSDSVADDSLSQAIASSVDEEEVQTAPEDLQHFPQLVMPSIPMPSRRPFTAKGKNMGKLKILVAGQSGMLSSTRDSPLLPGLVLTVLFV